MPTAHDATPCANHLSSIHRTHIHVAHFYLQSNSNYRSVRQGILT